MPPLKQFPDLICEVLYYNWWLFWIPLLILFWRGNLRKTDKAFSNWGWLLVILQSLVWAGEGIAYQLKYGFDFPIYYHAALGEFEWMCKRGSFGGMGEPIGWIYKDWLAVTWKPFTLFNIEMAANLWTLVGIIALLYTWYKIRNIRYASTLFAVLLPFTVVSQISGNIQTELVALCLTPLGSIIAGLYKPYCFLFSALHAFGYASYYKRLGYSINPFSKRFPRSYILHHKEDNMI